MDDWDETLAENRRAREAARERLADLRETIQRLRAGRERLQEQRQQLRRNLDAQDRR